MTKKMINFRFMRVPPPSGLCSCEVYLQVSRALKPPHPGGVVYHDYGADLYSWSTVIGETGFMLDMLAEVRNED